MVRRPIIVGNWKMHNDVEETRALLKSLHGRLGELREVDIGVAPPYTSLMLASEQLADNRILLAAQNVHYADAGAFTGEISPGMLSALGVDLVILGHSERRQHFGETEELVNLKVKATLSRGLGVILCVGETLEEREQGRTLQKLFAQVRSGLDGVEAADMDKVVLAYEPIWAIGTGRTATPAQAQDIHMELRGLVRELYGEGVAQQLRIQYGGSVKPGNAAQLLAEEDIDGALVGGASLKAQDFEDIVMAAVG